MPTDQGGSQTRPYAGSPYAGSPHTGSPYAGSPYTGSPYADGGSRAGLRPAPTELRFLANGRTALWAALQALGLGRGDALAVPAFICDSILPATEALGIKVLYYPVDTRLQPDLAAVDRLLDQGAGALLAVHYCGFEAPGFEAVLAACEQRGVPMIEDCAHALFSAPGGRPLGLRGAAAIFSPWKSLPLPDGGALALNRQPVGELPQDLSPPSHLSTARAVVYRGLGVVETAVGFTPRLALLRSRGLRRSMQARVAHSKLVPRRASRSAIAQLRAAEAAEVAGRRRANYQLLESVLSSSRWARLLFPNLPDGVCPLGLPILVRERERARSALLWAGVNVRAYWEQLPAEASVESFCAAHELARQILVLPVHQSLTRRHLAHLVSTLRAMEALPWSAS